MRVYASNVVNQSNPIESSYRYKSPLVARNYCDNKRALNDTKPPTTQQLTKRLILLPPVSNKFINSHAHDDAPEYIQLATPLERWLYM